jgi:hypothetical protein
LALEEALNNDDLETFQTIDDFFDDLNTI